MSLKMGSEIGKGFGQVSMKAITVQAKADPDHKRGSHDITEY